MAVTEKMLRLFSTAHSHVLILKEFYLSALLEKYIKEMDGCKEISRAGFCETTII